MKSVLVLLQGHHKASTPIKLLQLPLYDQTLLRISGENGRQIAVLKSRYAETTFYIFLQWDKQIVQ